MDRDDRHSSPTTPARPAWRAPGRLVSAHPVAALGVVLILTLAVQGLLAARDAQRTDELRDTLSRSHRLANALERRIGYGGLIHEFKNYVLRPDEDGYRVAALADARAALALADRLDASAAELGVGVGLDDTRDMIESYSSRLERVRELSANGRDPSFVDERVRFDDTPALLEVERLVSALDARVDERLAVLARRSATASTLATAATAALGLLSIAVVGRRGRRHADALGAINDELARTNDELVRANTSLSQFAGIVSHDLRTPLRHMEMASAMLACDPDDADTVVECTDIVGRSAVRMDRIVDSLLDFTRTGFATPRPEPVDAIELVEGVVEALDLGGRDDGARIDLDVVLAPGTRLRVDPVLMARALSSVVGNALKYTDPGVAPNVRVRVGRAASDGAGSVLIRISDDGIGIDARFAERIFEPMERLHGPESAYEGVGIGLSLARSIIEGHDGSIRLDTAVEAGTADDGPTGARFVIELPERCIVLAPCLPTELPSSRAA